MFITFSLPEFLQTTLLLNFAYLDPGSGSFILQILLASLVGIGFAFRNFWGKLFKRFRKETLEEETEDTDENDE